jgi:hypothetical protein
MYSALQRTKSLQAAGILYRNMYVALCRRHDDDETSVARNVILDLTANIDVDSSIINIQHNESSDERRCEEDNMHAETTVSVTIKQQSPFTKFFSDIVSAQNILNSADSTMPITNPCYSPQGFSAVNYNIHLYPLWSAALQNNPSRFAIDAVDDGESIGSICRSNAAIESHFRAVKHGRLQGRQKIRPRQFVAAQLQYVLGKVNEQKLPRTARRKVRDISNTKEVWSKRRRPARYTNPVVCSGVLRHLERRKKSTKHTAANVITPAVESCTISTETIQLCSVTSDGDDDEHLSVTKKHEATKLATHCRVKKLRTEEQAPVTIPVELDVQIDCHYINEGLRILRNMYPHIDGLEDPGFGCFSQHQSLPRFRGVQSKFVQIFHQPDHWVCATNVFSTLVNEIYWYDSLPKDVISENALIQLTSLLRHDCDNDYFDLHLRKCDRQPNNSVVCGFYALANAAAICAGDDPTLWRYDSSNLVVNISNGLRNNVLLPVKPRTMATTRSNINTLHEQKRHCLCYQASTDLMVMCSSCGNWYHEQCVHLNDDQRQRSSVNWNGPCCTQRDTDDPWSNTGASTTRVRSGQPSCSKYNPKTQQTYLSNAIPSLPTTIKNKQRKGEKFTFVKFARSKAKEGSSMPLLQSNSKPTQYSQYSQHRLCTSSPLCSTPDKNNPHIWLPLPSHLSPIPQSDTSGY